MDDKLFDKVWETTPKFNPIVAGNICYELMKDVEQVIIDTFVASQRDYPPQLRFVRMERVDPKTEFQHGGWTRDAHDIAKNTIYMTKLVFEFNGKPLNPFYLFLPYCYKGGIMTIGGSVFALNAVLIDPCFSVTENSIFINANKDKLTFTSTIYHYYENGNRVNEKIVCSQIYRGGDRSKSDGTYSGHRTRTMDHITALYLFSAYGFTETMKRYAGTPSVVIGLDDITEEYYPRDEWTICTTVGYKPKSYSGKRYDPVPVSIAIKTNEMSHVARALIASFYYIADHFTEFFEGDDVDSPVFYRRLLARMILPYQADQLAAYRDMERHLESLNSYIDERTSYKLRVVEGVEVKNIYDLFAEMIVSYENRATQTVSELTTMYSKRLVLLEYLLSDIIKSINKLGYEFQSAKYDTGLTAQKVEEKIKHHIKPLAILGLNNGHKEIASLQVACDNLIAKVSSPIILQSRMGKTNGKKVSLTLDMTLSASIAEVGSVTSTAGDMTGRSRLNMFTHVGYDGYIMRNPKLIDIVDAAQEKIKR